ncbi:hypothetical protein F4821DRAFT_13436 [Hypoxylon rubiginosum]|uniref:Uncharacterized protein n=1 Tax=Hypoxylon rubiginosum TaxID=110542 RepID=A0ACC0DED0_9PEZI|nr:hypothetical protein F4821DRAFT_13436 [Hypoxylon rubiginosum]
MNCCSSRRPYISSLDTMSSPSSDAVNGQSLHGANFKDKLDRAAENARNPKEKSGQPSLAEKVTKYLPPVAKLLGIGDTRKRQPKSPQSVPGPPERPHDDRHIEEFVRDQHKSKRADDGDDE